MPREAISGRWRPKPGSYASHRGSDSYRHAGFDTSAGTACIVMRAGIAAVLYASRGDTHIARRWMGIYRFSDFREIPTTLGAAMGFFGTRAKVFYPWPI